jgi:hypothetical protein
MYRQQWSSLNECALNNMIPVVASSRSSNSTQSTATTRAIASFSAAWQQGGKKQEDTQRDRLFNCVKEPHAEGEQMKGPKRVKRPSQIDDDEKSARCTRGCARRPRSGK